MAQDPFLGSIFMFAGNFAPTGYALCQGQLLSISQYSALFAILGTQFGGNGTTTFALPNLMGRAAIGTGTGAGLSPVVVGQMGGANAVSLTIANMPAHSHPVALSASNATATMPNPQGNVLAAVVDSNAGASLAYVPANNANTTMAPTNSGLAGSNIPVSIQNPYLGITFIIALQGIFPSRS